MSIHQALLAMLGAALLLSAGSAQEVKHGQEVRRFGAVVDPDGDCKIEATASGKVTITVPGTVHDLSFFNPKRNAPRLVQDVSGDFTAIVKVTGEFQPGAVPAIADRVAFNGAGLLIWDNEKHYIRLERSIWTAQNGNTTTHYALLEHWLDGKTTAHTPPSAVPLFKGQSTWLKLQRQGDTISASLSHDGQKWEALKSFNATLPKQVKVGVAAINTAQKPFTVHFEEFQVGAK